MAWAFGVLALAAIGLIAGAMALAPRLIARKIQRTAAGRGLTASWRSLRYQPPGGVALTGLVFAHGTADTTLAIDSLHISVDVTSLLFLHPRLERVAGAGVVVSPRAARPAVVDTLTPDTRAARLRADHLPRIRESARRVARLLCRAPERLPALELRDVTFRPAAGAEDEAETIRFDRLELTPGPTGVHFEARGQTRLEQVTPFVATLDYGHDGAIRGQANFSYGDGPRDALTFDIAARVERKTSPMRLRLAPDSRLIVGSLPFVLSGELGTEGPNLALTLEARDIRAEDIHKSVPPALLGPLVDVHARGWFDYALAFNANLARPDSLTFDADVTPHGLALDSTGTTLRLRGLNQPFTATIHLPHGRLVTRALDTSNPHFRTLDRIDSTLAHALITNEDGGFYRHHGFNTDAMKQAFAENLHAGGFRRGAGTITMQLARNLYLGHERTLSRKAQEVVLAWILEHLAGVSKHRLLELYLNIIEWGPGVHGADEASRYYFDHDAGSLTVAEALYLATVVPAPTRWRNRFDAAGELRPFARAQMHFIGRAMINKGWLAPDALPGTDSLRVALRGPARDVVFPASASIPPAEDVAAEPSPVGARAAGE